MDAGWITQEVVVQFKMNRNPIQIWKTRYQDRTISFKMSPVDISASRKESTITVVADEDSSHDHHDQNSTTLMGDLIQTWPVIEVAALNESEHEFHRQGQFGHVYHPDEYLILQAQMLHVDRTVRFTL